MSLSDTSTRTANGRRAIDRALVVAALIGTLVLAGCGFQPLYANRADGTSTVTELEGLAVAPIQGRVGQQVRNQIIFLATGGEEPDAPLYRLDVALRQSVNSILVEADGEASGRVVQLRATYQLTRVEDRAQIANGSGAAQAAFETFDEVYSNTRAQRDAENRAARELARAIHVRVAAVLDRPDI